MKLKIVLVIAAAAVIGILAVFLFASYISPQKYTEYRLESIEGRVLAFHDLNGRFPESLDDIVADGFPRELLRDYWGNHIHYTLISEGAILTSLGSDSKTGGGNSASDLTRLVEVSKEPRKY